MSQACPLLFRKIDATISKINAATVVVFVIVYLLTMCKLILFFLIIDFALRLSGKKSFSPIFLFANGVQSVFKLPVCLEDAGAKRLAAFFGLSFMIGILLSDFLGFTAGVWICAVSFISCVILDLLFDYCIACKIYSMFGKIFPKEGL
jgi:hypothetical protein